MSDGYPDGCTQAMHDAAWGDRDTTYDERIKIQLRAKAEDLAERGEQIFTDWLDAHPEQAIRLAIAACYWPKRKHLDGTWWTYKECVAAAEDVLDEARERIFEAFAEYYIEWVFEDGNLVEELRQGCIEWDKELANQPKEPL